MDRLAKEAAEETKEKKDLPPVIMMGDVKTAENQERKNGKTCGRNQRKADTFSIIQN